MAHLLRLVVLLCIVACPSLAHASDDAPERKGVVLGMAVHSGVASFGRSFVPVTRVRWIVGGGITDRITLTAELGAQALHGYKKLGYVGDIVATGFLGRGFFVRAGAGAVGKAIAAARDPLKPGFGGLVGLGYEFRVLERFAIGLGLDYDLRVRTDRLASQTLLLGLRIGGYIRK